MANVQLKIQTVNGDELQINNHDIKTVESTSQSNGQPNEIYYGSTPSVGFIEINDRKGELYSKITNGTLPNSNIPVELFVNGKKVQNHIATNSNYDINNQKFSLDFENRLSSLEQIIYEGYNYTGEEKRLYDIFVSFATKVGFTNIEVEKMLSAKIIYTLNGIDYIGQIADYFKAIIIPTPYIEKGTVRETLDKFCTLAQLNLIEDDNGDVVFVQARPLRTGSEHIIVIPAKNQLSSIERNIVIKNNAKNTNVVYKKVTKTIDEKSAIYSKVEKSPNRWYNPYIVSGSLVYLNGDDVMNRKGMCIQLSSMLTGYQYGKVVLKKAEISKNILDVTNDIGWTVSGKKRYGNARAQLKFSGQDGMWVRPIEVHPELVTLYGASLDDIDEDVNFEYETKFSSSYRLSTIQPFDYSYSYTQGYTNPLGYENEETLSHKISVNIDPIVTVTSTEEAYTIEYRIPIERTTIKMWTNYYNNSVLTQYIGGSFNSTDLENGNWVGYEKIIPERLDLSIYGTTVLIELDDANYIDIEKMQSTVTINGNEMLQENSEVNSCSYLVNVIANNIDRDYANGISTCRVTVSCNDYKDEYGVVRKEWAKGEIFQVGDIVRLDKDNNGTPAMTYKDGTTMLWKVTGRTFRHEGVPLIDLELQEIF